MNRRLVQHLSSVENFHRKNTIAIDLSTVFDKDLKPNKIEMYKFVHFQLELKAEELVDIQDHPFLPQVFIKLSSEEVLQKVEDKIQQGVKMHGKELTLYGWRCDVPLTTVRINGANPDTTKERIVEVMTKYGKVVGIEKGRVSYFKEAFVGDGTWILRIRPQDGKGLPSIIYYDDEEGNKDVWSLIFDGKVSVCYKCGKQGHRGDRCRAVRPSAESSGNKAPLGVGTYCDVVKKNVDVEWKGMTDEEFDENQQKDLVPCIKWNTLLELSLPMPKLPMLQVLKQEILLELPLPML